MTKQKLMYYQIILVQILFPHIFVWGSYFYRSSSARRVSSSSSSSSRPPSSSLSHSHSLTLTHTHSLTLSHSHSLTLTHSHSLTLSHSHSLTLTHTLSFIFSHSHSLTLTHSHSLTLTHSLTHAHSHTHSHSLSFTHSHSLTHSLTRSLTHSHSLTHGSCLEGQDVVARAAGGVRNRGRRSTLAMPLPKSWQAQHSVHLGVCLCGRGSIRQLSRGTGCCRARGGGVRNRGRRSTLAMPLPKSWQALHSVHLGVCLCGRGSIRQLSRGTGCWRACGGGCAKSWQAQHFGDAVAEVVAGAAFCASGCVFVWQG